MRHARQQILQYVATVLTENTGIRCDVHRKGLGEQYDERHLEVSIKDEGVGGSNESDEFEDTFESVTRIAPMTVKLTVKERAKTPEDVASDLCVKIEQAMSTASGEGDHYIGDALVSIQYAGMTEEDDDSLEAEMCQLSLIFSTSYRTEIGKPHVLI